MTINQLRKKIKTLALVTGDYPKEIKISKADWEDLNKIDKFEGVKLIVK